MKINTEPVRGTKDYGPKEMEIRDFVTQKILSTYKQNGFLHIKTPILEDINLLDGSDGGDNLKLMFKILKRGEKLNLEGNNLKERDLIDMGLRYDLTVPLARFYANNQNNLPKPFKSIQIDDSFRAERPQRGRYRQFTQCDIDILGDNSENAEIEILQVAGETLQNIGFENFTFKINDRRILNNLILTAGFSTEDLQKVCITLDKRDKIGYEGIKKELLENGYNETNIDNIISILADITEKGIDALYNTKVDIEYIDRLKRIIDSVNYLSKNKYKVEFDISIIRGQGYYTSTVMEVYLDGFSGASGGGGRYDEMIGKIINVPTTAVGFSIGYERVCLILQEMNKKVYQETKTALIYDKNYDFVEVMKQKEQTKGIVMIVPKAKNLQNQVNKLRDLGIDNFVMLSNNQWDIADLNKIISK